MARRTTLPRVASLELGGAISLSALPRRSIVRKKKKRDGTRFSEYTVSP